jgi:WD40 repeat protein
MQGRHPIGVRADPARATAVLRSDGRRLATVGPDGELKVWDTARPRRPVLLTRLRPRRRVVTAAWNPAAANLLATLSAAGGIAVWRIVDDRPPAPVWVVDEPTPGATTLVWLLDGRHLACGNPSGEISVWDADSGLLRARIAGRRDTCLALSAGADDMLRLAFRDGTVAVVRLRVPGGAPVTGTVPPITAASWSASGSSLAVAGETGAIEMLDPRLAVRCVPAATFGARPVLGWAGDRTLLVVDRSTAALTAIDDTGRARWRTPALRPSTSLSVAGDLIALGGCRATPLIVGLDRGDLLTPN